VRLLLQNEVTFSSFAEFKKAYFMPFLVTFQKLAVEKGAAKDDKDMKEKGKRMAGPLMKWIKAHFDELQFYSLETYMTDGADLDDKYKDVQFAANVAMVRYEGATPYFYFIKDAYTEVRAGGGGRGRRWWWLRVGRAAAARRFCAPRPQPPPAAPHTTQPARGFQRHATQRLARARARTSRRAVSRPVVFPCIDLAAAAATLQSKF
jgi:hypothetical protein